MNPIVFRATWTALGPAMATLRLATALLMAVAVVSRVVECHKGDTERSGGCAPARGYMETAASC